LPDIHAGITVPVAITRSDRHELAKLCFGFGSRDVALQAAMEGVDDELCVS
jgi:hypothetical protein